MQVKMNERVFTRLLNQYRKNFPGYTLPDNADAFGNSYAVSGDDVSISQQLKNALLQNSPEYQKFKKNNPDLFDGIQPGDTGFREFQKEFLGLNRPAPEGAYTPGSGGITRFSNPSNLLSAGEITGQIFGQRKGPGAGEIVGQTFGQQNRSAVGASGFSQPRYM